MLTGDIECCSGPMCFGEIACDLRNEHEMYSTTDAECAAIIILVLVWKTKCAKNDFYILVPSDLDLWPLKLKFAPLVTLVVSYVSTKLEVSIAFLFRENPRHGTDTEGVQRLMWPPGYGRIISGCISENVQDRHIAITRKLYVLYRTTWSPVTLNYLAECYQQHDKLFDGVKHLELKVMHWIALDLKKQLNKF